MRGGKINAGPLTSPRLRGMLELLRRRGARGVSWKDYANETGFGAANTVVSELRRHGFMIESHTAEKTVQGYSVHRWYLVGDPQGVAAQEEPGANG